MLDKHYNVKVIDFGDARRVNEELDDEDEEGGEGMNMLRRGTFVGTVNYQSPEVINEEDQGLPIDTWALGNILFKMLTGHVPFKGSVAPTVYKDIKNRNIQWPAVEVIDEIMSKEAQDLINRMIQLEPKNRLGHDLESTQLLKQHPFFNGIDWNAISQKNYEGNYKPMLQAFQNLNVKEDEEYGFDLASGSLAAMQPPKTASIDKNKILLKGNLLKKNRYWKK